MRKFSRYGKEKKKVYRLPLSVWLSYLLVATMVLTGVTFSGYVTTVSNEDAARVAVMGTDVSIPVQLTQYDIQPGGTNVFKFEVTNQTNGRVCEVALRYTMTARAMTTNIPLDYKFYSDADCTQLVTAGTLPAGKPETHTYWIKATWAGTPDSSMAFEVDAITVMVQAEQID